MKNTICYPLAQLGYAGEYFITEQGFIIARANNRYYQQEQKSRYSLKTKDGRRVRRTVKSLYRQAFGREYSIDIIEDLPREVWKPIDNTGKYYISSLGRVKSYQGTKTKLLKP